MEVKINGRSIIFPSEKEVLYYIEGMTLDDEVVEKFEVVKEG